MVGSVVSLALEGARLNALLVAAIELRLCEHLAAGPATVPELARRAGIAVRGCQVVADGMVALKLWRVEGGVYSNSRTADDLLLPQAPGFVGEEHPALFRAWLPRFARVTDLVRSGEPSHALDSAATRELWSLLTPMLARRGRSVPPLGIAALELAGGTPRLLDLGGGAAALWSRALLEANGAARATQVDWPEINASARDRVERAGFGARFRTLDGDFHAVELGRDAFDVAVLSHIVHQESPDSCVEILGRVARALADGGHVVVVDWLVDDGRSGPASALLFNLTMLLLSEGGKSYERRELGGMLAEAGFAAPTFTPTDDMSVMAIARKR
jgi:SAM-dependent methyltransferase